MMVTKAVEIYFIQKCMCISAPCLLTLCSALLSELFIFFFIYYCGAYRVCIVMECNWNVRMNGPRSTGGISESFKAIAIKQRTLLDL